MQICKTQLVGTYLTRSLEPVLERAAAEFPAVVLTGPRQSGKTTTLKHLYGRSSSYVSLEPPDVRRAAKEDPRGFLALHRPPVIFDEVQYAAGLLPYLKELIDENRDTPGQYLLTGSHNLMMMERVTESLAGRAAVLKLLPLSRRETEGRPDLKLPWEREPVTVANAAAHQDLWRSFLRGYYPELATDPGRSLALWHGSYVQTYLERDVRSLRQVGDLSQFQAFLRSLALRSGQLLNLSDLSRDLGIAVNTARAWLAVLEATYQVIVLRPHHTNIGKRLVKTPKVYFTDVGTLCSLVGLRDPLHAATGPMGGAIFETAVVAEVYKSLVHCGFDPQLSFWRTASGVEVDLLVEQGQAITPVEVKVSATPNPRMAGSLRQLAADVERVSPAGWLIHPGDIVLPLGGGVTALPFGQL